MTSSGCCYKLCHTAPNLVSTGRRPVAIAGGPEVVLFWNLTDRRNLTAAILGMSIEFRCIRCQQRLRVGDEVAGLRARCPNCNAVVVVPSLKSQIAVNTTASNRSDVIDYELVGDACHYVEITLDPGEAVGAKLEHLLFMTSGIAIETAASHQVSDGFFDLLNQLGRRILAGGRSDMMAFCNVTEHREKVAFAPARMSQLAPLHLNEMGHQVYCRSDSVLCIARGIELKDADLPGFRDSLMRVSGAGVVVIQGAGLLVRRALQMQQTLRVLAASVIAFTSEIRLEPCPLSNIDEDKGVAIVQGPGEVWLRPHSWVG